MTKVKLEKAGNLVLSRNALSGGKRNSRRHKCKAIRVEGLSLAFEAGGRRRFGNPKALLAYVDRHNLKEIEQ